MAYHDTLIAELVYHIDTNQDEVLLWDDLTIEDAAHFADRMDKPIFFMVDVHIESAKDV